ncbi:hypothetical protein BHE74_00043158 [Ensete ventricosum]|nr:hypothetical protein BHE74_00043158 [Ensete ventricosum]
MSIWLNIFYTPPPSAFVAAMSVISCASLAYSGLSEARGRHLQYSKFWNSGRPSDDAGRTRISSREGMLLLYTPALAAAAASLGVLAGERSLLLGLALLLHFFKRDFEVCTISFLPPAIDRLSAVRPLAPPVYSVGYLRRVGHVGGPYLLTKELYIYAILHHSIRETNPFVFYLLSSLQVLFIHRYSGSMMVDTAIPISLGYFLNTVCMIYAQYLTQGGVPEPAVDLKYAGVVLFLVGITGNFYHHYLLSKLREKKGDKRYRIPKGGLFRLVVCPHYLFEILGFVGVSLISQTVFAFSVAAGTVFYLMGRSYATRRWYLSKFQDFPKQVKALIPYVY